MTRSFLHRAGLLVLIALLTAPVGRSAAQDRYAEIAARQSRAQVYAEALILPGEAVPETIITFRIPNSMLVFMQDGEGFVAHAEVGVELYRDGEKIDEAVWRGDQRAESFEETRSDLVDAEGRVRFEIMPGSYGYRIVLAGAKASMSGAPPKPFTVTDFTDGGIGSPFFVSGSDIDSAGIALEPTNLGGHVPFGEAAQLAVPVRFSGQDAKLAYRVYKRSDAHGFERRRGDQRSARERSEDQDEEIELAADDQLVRDGSIRLDEAAPIGELQPDCICWSVNGSNVGTLALIEIESETLENGAYLLDVMLSSSEETLKQRTPFRTHWRDMPMSLFDVNVAIRNLSFIETRDKIRSMLRGSREDQVEVFREYWKQRDPSPGTVVNELMQEYYERIDYAASEFRTGRTPFPDGLRTDAARIYIVHGPPDDVSSTLPTSGGVQQVWTYPDGRQFIFWAASSLEPLVLEETTISRGGVDNGGS